MACRIPDKGIGNSSEFLSPNSQTNNNSYNTLYVSDYQISSISTLPPIESSNSNSSTERKAVSHHQLQQCYGFPLLQNDQIQTMQGVSFANSVQSTQPIEKHRGIGVMATAQPASGGQELAKNLDSWFKELEMFLNGDNNNEEGCIGEAVSVNISNLISLPSCPSPTTNTSSGAMGICARPVLMEAAKAIDEGKPASAKAILSRVGCGARKGNAEERLMYFLFSALKSRMNSVAPVADLYEKEYVSSIRLLYMLSPCFKLGFMAANLAILESTLDSVEEQGTKQTKGFHLVDFDIGQGGQYMHLLLALAERLKGSPTMVKITVVPDGSGGEEENERLKSIGGALGLVAEWLGVKLHFNVVGTSYKLGHLSRELLGCEVDEQLAVNFAFKLYKMPDESVSTENPRDELLRSVRAMEPRVVTVVEQDMNGNTTTFLTRVNEACSYYGALLESIEATIAMEATRGLLEEGIGKKLANAVACEGKDRVERCEVFGKWRARMEMAGFKPKPLSQAVIDTIRGKLNLVNRANPGFTVKEDHGGASFGWKGKSLTVASAWR